MVSDQRDAIFSAESPDLEEDGVGGAGGETDSDEDLRENEDVVIPEAEDEDQEYEDLNSPSMVSTAPLVSAAPKPSSSTGTVTVALPAGSSVPLAAIPVDSEPKWHRMTEIVHQRPPIDDSRRLFQRLWTDEDEIELLRGFLDYITNHRGSSSHPPDMAPFYEQIKSKLQLDFNKNQLVEKLRRLKKKYRNVMSKISSGKEVFFKSPHDQATFDISRKIWNQTGKIIGFEDNNVMDLEETNNHHNINGTSSFNIHIANPTLDMDSENGLDRKVTMGSNSGSRKRSRSRIGKIEEDNVPIPNVNLNENAADFNEVNNLGGLIEETVKNCVSPMIKEMMNGTTQMMMAALGGGGNGLGVYSPMLMPSMNLGFGGGAGGKGVGDERWRRQQILELEVYSRRLELVQDQIRAKVNELKTMP